MRTLKTFTTKEIRQLVGLPSDTKVRVWSGQHPDALRLAQERGYLTADPEFIEPYWLPAYAWMRDQMADRLSDHSGDYPVWGWLKSQSWKKGLRRVTGFGEETVRVIAEVPRSRILFSDYDTWHMPLNSAPITSTEAEYDAIGDNKAKTMATWDRVFEFYRPRSANTDWSEGPTEILQACIDRIYLDEIIETKD